MATVSNKPRARVLVKALDQVDLTHQEQPPQAARMQKLLLPARW